MMTFAFSSQRTFTLCWQLGIESVVSNVSVVSVVKLAFVVNGALLALVFVTAVVCGN